MAGPAEGEGTADPVPDVGPEPVVDRDSGPTQEGEDPTTTRVGRVQYAARPPRAERLAAHRRRRRGRRRLGAFMLGAGVLLLLIAGWVGFRVYEAYQHLQQAADTVHQIQGQVTSLDSLDVSLIRTRVSDLQQQAGDARSDVEDPLYRVAARIPWIGPNLTAVSDISETVDDIATRTMPALVNVANLTSSGSLAPQNGTINVQPIADLSGPLQAADEAVTAGRVRMSRINAGDLITPVGNAVESLWRELDKASQLTATGARLGRMIPPMLGGDGARNYLVVFQNLAEARATGGIFGSYALVRVDNGQVTIVDQGSASRDIRTFQQPVVNVSDDLLSLFTERISTNPVDVNFTPNFPAAASIFAQMYRERKGVAVDGVVALDPVVISYLLKGHPPIPVGNGVTISSDNAVSVLLSKVYEMFPENKDVPARDVFLDQATTAVFKTLMTGGLKTTGFLKGLVTSASQHRILIWSSRSSEQADLAQTSLASPLPVADASGPHIGVFFNDGTGGKLDYYLSGSVSAVPAGCESSGERHLTVTTSMNYGAPTRGLPPYVLGLQQAGPYVLRTNVLTVAPMGGTVQSVTVNGHTVAVAHGIDGRRAVAVVTVELSPGQKSTVTADVLAPPSVSGSSVSPVLVVTPGVSTWTTTAKSYPTCRQTPKDGAMASTSR